MKLIIQIPCYNEEQTIGITLHDLPTKIKGIETIEYLIINDGSTDDTVRVARENGAHHIVSFPQHKGLAFGFKAGIDACLKLNADIIVNTDADNQYNGADIAKLVAPIIEGKAEIVIGERPIDATDHFSPLKKKLQHIGSFIVRIASSTQIPDAPSGFRAYNRDAALQINVFNNYTYTLETIIQAGQNKMAILSVPIRINPELRKSRLFNNMFGYLLKSSITILRTFIMYSPLKFFGTVGLILFFCGVAAGINFLYFLVTNTAHITSPNQSLILSVVLIIIGCQTILIGLQADIISANRKILEDIQKRVRDMHSSQKNTL